MDDSIKISEVRTYLVSQILSLQIDWMDYHNKGDSIMTRQQEVVLDGIYAFIEHFMGIPAPAPGQGYQPPADVYTQTIKDRQVAQIDQQISDLVAQREKITNEPYSPPLPAELDGDATLDGMSSLSAEPDEG